MKREVETIISPTTQAQYINVFRSILELAVKKRLTPSNPAQGVKSLMKEQVRAKDRRLPFAVAQISQFFGSEIYKTCAPDAQVPYSKADCGSRLHHLDTVPGFEAQFM